MTQPFRKLVLCIDDEAALLRMLKATLEVLGYAAVTSSCGAEALQIARQNLVDAVILDYCMPDGNGTDLALEIKRACPGTPILMFSGTRVPAAALFAVDGFVAKQEGTLVLASVLERLIACGPSARRLARKSPRYPIAVPFVISVQRTNSTQVLQGVSVDIGEGGLGGRLEGELLPGELVDVRIFDPNLESFHPRAQVRYRKENLCGLEFLDLTPAQQAVLRQSFPGFASA